MSIFLNLLSCALQTQQIQTKQTFTPPPNWPTINKSESDFRHYFDNNLETLNPLEGIWSVDQTGSWRDVYSGRKGKLPQRLLENSRYRIAILRDSSKTNYDFICVILESQNPDWTSGRIKAYFRKTAYEKVYEGLWYMGDYSEERSNYAINEFGLIENTETNYSAILRAEITIQQTFIKAYPPYSGKSRPSGENKLKGTGSGFLMTNSGLIVTNYHVVEDANRIEIAFPEKNITKTAIIRIKDKKNDLVILEIKDFSYSVISNQPIPFSFADANSIKIGQEVFTLGFPLGDIMGTKSRLSTGRINSLFGIQDDPRLLQVSNPLQPGNSGGPLFNYKGELVGIVVSSLSSKYFYENVGIIPQNVNFAIKLSYLQNLVSMINESDELNNRKNLVKQTSLDIQIEQLNPFIVQVKTY